MKTLILSTSIEATFMSNWLSENLGNWAYWGSVEIILLPAQRNSFSHLCRVISILKKYGCENDLD